jgi:hypothetical protein
MNFLTIFNLLSESSLDTYDIPKDKIQLFADFYGIEFLLHMLENPTETREFRIDDATIINLRSSFKDIKKYLVPMLMDDIFWACSCEFGHVFDNNGISDVTEKLKKDEKTQEFIRAYHKNFGTIPDIDVSRFSDYLQFIFKESAETGSIHREYSKRFRVLAASMKDASITQSKMMDIFEDAFDHLEWSRSYGGIAWSNIAKGWKMLSQVKSPNDVQAIIAIDHAIDLAHNSGSIFTKNVLYNVNINIRQLNALLDEKRNLHIKDWANRCSSEIQRLLSKVLGAHQSADYAHGILEEFQKLIKIGQYENVRQMLEDGKLKFVIGLKKFDLPELLLERHAYNTLYTLINVADGKLPIKTIFKIFSNCVYEAVGQKERTTKFETCRMILDICMEYKELDIDANTIVSMFSDTRLNPQSIRLVHDKLTTIENIYDLSLMSIAIKRQNSDLVKWMFSLGYRLTAKEVKQFYFLFKVDNPAAELYKKLNAAE